MDATSSKSAALNRSTVTNSGLWVLMLVTRLATDFALLDWNFAALGRRAAATSVKLLSTMMQPWCRTRPRFTYWELPEIFFPSMVMSFLPVNSAWIPKRFRAARTGRMKY